MHPSVWLQVVGHKHPSKKVTLTGYRRYALEGLLYPAVFPHPGGEVAGVLYTGLGPAEWKLLDQFEGENYSRIPVQVLDSSGEQVDCQTYEGSDKLKKMRSDVPWDFNRFKDVYLDEFIRTYGGF